MRSDWRRRRRLWQMCWGGGFMTGIFVVGSEGSSSCFFLFLLSSLLLLLLPPPQVLMDGLRRGGKNPWLVMSESCLNAQRGGRRERERDSKAVSRGARACSLPLGLARRGGGCCACPRSASVRPGCCAPLSRTAAVRTAARQRLGSRRTAATTSWSSASQGRGRVREKARGALSADLTQPESCHFSTGIQN
ncbi:uncharacterized protein LOC104651107 [Saimiri boliviensis]|uniref:uncharacterized protein LOC104651107 n=1 Tax=Saimiri boliviensis TaxID=27679 RepID=UPI003D7707D9